MYEFDEDTRVAHVAEGLYRARISERWSIGHVPNGGYVLAVAASAIGDAIAAPDPLAVTAHFVRPAEDSEAEISVDVVKIGKTYTTAEARLVQAGAERLRVLATYGDLSAGSGPAYVDATPPEVPSLDTPVPDRADAMVPEIAKRFEQRLAPETLRWMRGERHEPAEIRGLVRFADGRPPDTRSLLLFADALPPPAFNVITPGWLPTLELSVHVRKRPVPGYLRARFRTRFLFGGLLEEDGELWDESGALVALSRQLAAMPRQ